MSESPSNLLGVEIGGTKLQAAIGDARGRILHAASTVADAAGGRPVICGQLLYLIRRLLADNSMTVDDLSGAGVGFGGPVDVDQGIVVKSHQVDGWDRFPLADWFRTELGIETEVNNDSDLAGLAEARLGAGRGFSPVVYMNVGSGIGGAIIVNGELFAGQGLGGAEIGHLRIRPNPDGVGWQTLESLASGWSIARVAEHAAQTEPESVLASVPSGELTVQRVVEAVRGGDRLAVNVWRQAIEDLGVAVANVITLLHPQRLIVGGGVALAGELLFGPLRDEVERHVFKPFSGRYELVPAQLEQNVVLHGALLWAGRTMHE